MLGSVRFPFTDEARVSTYYGVFFLTVGSVMPFVAIWLDSLGMSTAMSGAILAAPPLSIVLFNIIIGSWADRLSDWRSAIVGCNILVLILISGLLWWQSHWGVFVLWTLSGLFMIASAPITDAAALDMTERRGSDFAKVRAFGSAGFVVGVAFCGWFFDIVGMQGFIWVLITGGVIRLAAAVGLPRFKDRLGTHKKYEKATLASNLAAEHLPHTQSEQAITEKTKLFSGLLAGMALFRQPGIFSVILGSALINASHSFFNIYAVLHWTQNGISTSLSSILWTIGVIAEVGLMWGFSRFAKNIPARHCLLLASGVCMVRWTVTGLNPSVSTLMVLQSFHAITFGLTFLASVNFIARRVEHQHAAQAQSVLATLTTLLMAIGTWLSGQSYALWGGQSYWLMSVMALLGGGFVLNSYRTPLDDVNRPVVS